MLQEYDLARAYDREFERRSNSVPAEWKPYERESFARLLQSEGKRTLLEIGSGPGTDGRYFQSRGLEVDCVGLSPEMVRHCRERGRLGAGRVRTEAIFRVVYRRRRALVHPYFGAPHFQSLTLRRREDG
ncbi:hypothetical protein SAMN02799624_00588 [Paenibacillus sp. UNC496MF]|uniref:class I SAM-dependent methyltransferase n=1 Tax=Paenibacillus sp. UNC496MF TaxID=1502753 RepID=UPI0008EA06A5|nr:class I SAM-dependent methyltransferase [Paenibacillus sp. UNC496MF]SFI36067.1 hypothetical protein SAMN02799624_00588 [Paenibacillus sp. UNC496MF]